MPRQDAESFIGAIENAFRHFGGIPLRLRPDNLKAAVLKADWHDPKANPKLLSFAERYGFSILPTRPYSPKRKGKIERNVQSLKGETSGRRFASLAALNARLRDYEANVAERRIHGTTKRQVIEHSYPRRSPRRGPFPTARSPATAKAGARSAATATSPSRGQAAPATSLRGNRATRAAIGEQDTKIQYQAHFRSLDY